MVEIRHLENRHDVIFFWRGWSELVKMSQTGAKWHVDCGYMVEIETRCSSAILEFFSNMADVWRLQWHVIPEPRITLQGAATWWIHCRDSKAICHIAGCSHLAKSVSWSCHITGCKNSIRHIENRLSPYFFLVFFYCIWALTSGGFRIVSDTLVSYAGSDSSISSSNSSSSSSIAMQTNQTSLRGRWRHSSFAGFLPNLIQNLTEWSKNYRVSQIKRGQLTFLLVGNKQIYKIKWFLAGINYIQQQVT